ncbi:MAG: polysaccharide deacetylase family protein [Hyphomicrobiaceae bacterium]
MGKPTTLLLRSVLATIHYTGAGRAMAPVLRGNGAIFMLHHVSPEPVPAFAPNRNLTVTPAYLETVIKRVRAAGFEIVGMDEACRRMREPDPGRAPFAAFTFDDGYRDNRDHALPVLARHGAPCTVYVCPDFADGIGDLWWLTLENVVRQADSIEVPATLGGKAGETLSARTSDEKYRAFDRLYWPIRAGDERVGRQIVQTLAMTHGVDPLEPCRRLVMDWGELHDFAQHPLVTIGAHTMSHFALGKLADDEARWQMAESIARIRSKLGLECRHICYPYGDKASAGPREFEMARALGVASAVTTRKGMIKAHHSTSMTGLPRVSLNGDFQGVCYLDALLSGLPFACYDIARPLATAARRLMRGQRSQVATAGVVAKH